MCRCSVPCRAASSFPRAALGQMLSVRPAHCKKDPVELWSLWWQAHLVSWRCNSWLLKGKWGALSSGGGAMNLSGYFILSLQWCSLVRGLCTCVCAFWLLAIMALLEVVCTLCTHCHSGLVFKPGRKKTSQTPYFLLICESLIQMWGHKEEAACCVN